jgi:hypothetical protein
LAAYEHVLEAVLNSFLGTGDTSYLKQFAIDSDFNDTRAAARKDLSIQAVLAKYNDTQARVTLLVPTISAELWRKPGTLPWYGGVPSISVI